MIAKADLSTVLADASGSTRHRPATEDTNPPAPPASRAGTVTITGHFPREVRDQLKILAIKQGKTLQTLYAEAFNDLFAKYGEPEIAPKS